MTDRAIELPLAAELIAGAGDAPVVVLAHGITQNRWCWGDVADRLGRRFAVWAVDLPGHGDSGHATASFETAALLLADTVDAIAARASAPPGGRPIVVGYSMGGRLALRALLDRPDVAEGLVLVGATAGIDSPDERAARRASDAALADRLRSIGAERFLDEWLGLALFADLSDRQQHREARLAHWGTGVADTFEHRGTGSMEPLWSRLGELAAPTLVLAGDADHKFVAIGDRLAAGADQVASMYQVPGAGHACHLSAPVATADAITGWFERRPGGQ